MTWFANDASSVGLLSFVSLPLTLPTLREAFNCRSLTWCFHQSSTKWFAINACTSNAVGLLPSLRKLLTDSTERATSKCYFIIVTHFPKCKDNNSFSITKTKTYNYSCKKNFSYIPCSIQKQILLLHLDSIFVSKSQQRCSQCNFYITIPVVMTTKVLSYNTVIMTV